jgi:hypothetical protein
VIRYRESAAIHAVADAGTVSSPKLVRNNANVFGNVL